ncbi:MAG: hypothetical protein ACJ8F3_03745 [Xanthobacteraceae bacterium]
MASTLNAVLCATAGLLLWTLLGLPLARRLTAAPLALPFAPMLGWAVHSALALPIFLIIPFSAASLAAVTAIILLACAAAVQADKSFGRYSKQWPGGTSRKALSAPSSGEQTALARGDPIPGCVKFALQVPAWAYLLAALLAIAPAAAILPKHVGDAVILADPIFDHAKVAIIDEMRRLGLPPGNPFFASDGGGGRLAYYYLWYFSAAELAVLLGVTGWEADVAMTWFSAFSSLALMMGLAVWCSGRASAAAWVVALALSGSGRFWLWLLGADSVDAALALPGGFAGWLFQSAWVPQHIASASCVVLSVYLMSRLAQRSNVLLVGTLVLVLAAGFESSTWVGGIALAVAAVALVPTLVLLAPAKQRLPLIAGLMIAGVLALCLAIPLLRDQFAAAALRSSDFPIALHPFAVLSETVAGHLRSLLNLPAFWMVFLPLELPAIYVTGLVVIAALLAARNLDDERTHTVAAFAALAGGCLVVSWLLASTLAYNNDLGWRAVLPAVMVLTVFAAVGLARWIATRAVLPATLALGAIIVGLPNALAQIQGNVMGDFSAEGTTFAEAPEMWAKVRLHTGIAERVANNPLALKNMTPWPVNISWSLLANRRSCYAGRELTLVYASLRRQQLEAVDAKFIRVFAGDARDDDIRELATTYDCRVILVTREDGAWERDPFAGSPLYHLVEEKPDRWRIYRATGGE